MRVILLGDLHCYRLGLWPWQMLSKRVLGQTNLWLNRRSRFDLDGLGPLAEQVQSLSPDLLLLSGDLTTTSLPGDFEMARRWLRPLATRFDTFVVPGNHDRYTFAADRGRLFEKWLGTWSAPSWPYHRPLPGGLHLLGLDPTRATFMHAWGRLGDRQLSDLRRIVGGIESTDRLLVLCHYPLGTASPPPGIVRESRHHRLRDADALEAILGGLPQEVLYLHGHVHRPWCWRLAEAANVVAINAGAPLMMGGNYPAGQGFWQIDLEPAPGILRHHHRGADGTWGAVDVAWPRSPGDVAKLGGQA